MTDTRLNGLKGDGLPPARGRASGFAGCGKTRCTDERSDARKGFRQVHPAPLSLSGSPARKMKNPRSPLLEASQQVFGLTGGCSPTCRDFPKVYLQCLSAAFVPVHRCGTVPESHRIPFSGNPWGCTLRDGSYIQSPVKPGQARVVRTCGPNALYCAGPRRQGSRCKSGAAPPL